MTRIGLLVAAALALAGCMTTSPPPVAGQVPAGMARITVTRSGDLMYLAAPAQLDVAGNRVASLALGESYTGDFAPGPVTLTTQTWSYPGRFSVRIKAEPGKTYAFQISPRGDSYIAATLGGAAGMAVDASVSENAGAFKITPVR